MSDLISVDDIEPARDIVQGGFRLRVLGYQFPDAKDDWDSNWLIAEAECVAKGARVVVQGPFLMVHDLAGLAALSRGRALSEGA